jgi:hypothetical protein
MIHKVYVEDENGRVYEMNPHEIFMMKVVCLPKQLDNAAVAAFVSFEDAQHYVETLQQEINYVDGNKLYAGAMGHPWDPPYIRSVSGVTAFEVLSSYQGRLVYDPKNESDTSRGPQSGQG